MKQELGVVKPRGIFRANHTRDGEATSRDGQTFYLANELPSKADVAIFEIMFEDGCWMLATLDDLVFF